MSESGNAAGVATTGGPLDAGAGPAPAAGQEDLEDVARAGHDAVGVDVAEGLGQDAGVQLVGARRRRPPERPRSRCASGLSTGQLGEVAVLTAAVGVGVDRAGGLELGLRRGQRTQRRDRRGLVGRQPRAHQPRNRDRGDDRDDRHHDHEFDQREARFLSVLDHESLFLPPVGLWDAACPEPRDPGSEPFRLRLMPAG